jgi:cardiolipin synthase
MSVPIVWALLERRFDLALLLFLMAGFSDGLDGYLAKRFDWSSHLGGILDPVADKVLLVSSFFTLGLLGLIPCWLVFSVIIRDLLIVSGATLYYFRIKRIDAEPSLISKLNTVVQIALVLSIVLDKGLFALPPMLIQGLIWITLATTLASGLDYIWIWGRRAIQDSKEAA